MKSYAYYNGKFDKKENIAIPLSDRSIFFGECVYDAAIGSYDRILWEEEHIDRLLNNAKRIGIRHNYTKEYLSAILREVAVKSCIPNYFIYFAVSMSSNQRIHSSKSCKHSNLLITVDKHEITTDSHQLRLITRDDLRYGFCDIKTTNLLPAALASTEAEAIGCDEVVFTKDGIITECAKSNISILFQGRLITHPKSSKILPGITREHLLQIARGNNIETVERPFTVNELFCADEILITSSSKLCRRVCEIDGKRVGNKSPQIASLLCKKMYEIYSFVCL